MRSDRWIAHSFGCSDLDVIVAALGTRMKKRACAALLLCLLAILAGCGKTVTAQEVRDRDGWRREVSKHMPGNDVPIDPADVR